MESSASDSESWCCEEFGVPVKDAFRECVELLDDESFCFAEVAMELGERNELTIALLERRCFSGFSAFGGPSRLPLPFL